MEKIKNFFKKHKNIIISIVDFILTILVFISGFLLGQNVDKNKYIASAEEVVDDDPNYHERDEVQPPSVLFEAIYEGGVYISSYLIAPSIGDNTSYAGQWQLNEDYYGVSGSYLYVTPIDGIQGLISFQYGGYMSANPPFTYKFTFSNIYTHFTDQFEWGYIETTEGINSITYEFEIYDYQNKKFDYITYNLVLNEPSYHTTIDPTDVLSAWGYNQDPAINPIKYYIGVFESQDAMAYIRTYSISFTSNTRDEQFHIGYTGNINIDITGYMNVMQRYGESKVPDTELSGFYVLNSIVDAVDSFMSIEILPNFSFYDILYICIAIPLTMWLLKLWLGG